MRQSWSVPVLLALAALAGYAAGARPVQAQSQPLPFSVGETVTFRFADDGSRDCRITDIKGMFALCESPSEGRGPTFGRPSSPEPPEEWFNIAVVERVEGRRERK
jgi:hypothetical protein